MFKRLGQEIIDLLLPRECPCCGQRLTIDERIVCAECMMRLPWETKLDWTHNPRMVMSEEHPCLQRIGALMRYHRGNTASQIIHQLKFHHRPDLGPWMGRLAVKRLQASGLFEGVEVLVPIPLSRTHLYSRGFNQSEWIARGIAEALGIEMRTDVLRRRKGHESQTHFTYEERLKNADNAFERTAQAQTLAGRHVMLVDDVITTGATMLNAIQALEKIDGIRLSSFAWAWLPHPPQMAV